MSSLRRCADRYAQGDGVALMMFARMSRDTRVDVDVVITHHAASVPADAPTYQQRFARCCRASRVLLRWRRFMTLPRAAAVRCRMPPLLMPFAACLTLLPLHFD